MRQIYLYKDKENNPMQSFLQALTPKLRHKLYRQFEMMRQFPGAFGEPHIKHFRIERYRMLYELREKHCCALVRIIFTMDKDSNIILLEPFIKTHSRSTETALESALYKLECVLESREEHLCGLNEVKTRLL